MQKNVCCYHRDRNRELKVPKKKEMRRVGVLEGQSRTEVLVGIIGIWVISI